MAISKVDFGGRTLIDLTNDSVTPENLMVGATAHGADGELVQGSATGGGSVIINNLTNNQQTDLKKITLTDSELPDSYICEPGELVLQYGDNDDNNDTSITILKNNTSPYLEKIIYDDRIVLFCNEVAFNNSNPYIMDLISEIWATNTIKRGSYNPIMLTASSQSYNGFIKVMPKLLSFRYWPSAYDLSTYSKLGDLTKSDPSTPISDRWSNTASSNYITGEVTFYI